MAKYWATDLENKVAGDCLRLRAGASCGRPILPSPYSNARVQTIYIGTNEIMKELIARNYKTVKMINASSIFVGRKFL